MRNGTTDSNFFIKSAAVTLDNCLYEWAKENLVAKSIAVIIYRLTPSVNIVIESIWTKSPGIFGWYDFLLNFFWYVLLILSLMTLNLPSRYIFEYLLGIKFLWLRYLMILPILDSETDSMSKLPQYASNTGLMVYLSTPGWATRYWRTNSIIKGSILLILKDLGFLDIGASEDNLLASRFSFCFHENILRSGRFLNISR